MPGTIVMVDSWAPKASWPTPGKLKDMFRVAALCGRATFLQAEVIPLPDERSREGSPLGGTAWAGLDESHVTLHWRFEEDRVRFALDVFTCGDHASPLTITKWLCRAFNAEVAQMREVGRFKG